MDDDSGIPELTDSDIEELANKLEEFAGTLNPAESLFFQEMLAHAAIVGGEPVGYKADDLVDFLMQLYEAYSEERNPPGTGPVGMFFGR